MVGRLCVLAAVLAFPMGVLAEEGEAAGAKTPPALVKGDRIVFLGDSITAGGGGPKGYITLVKSALTEKLPDLGIEVFNAGISGNRVPDLQRRLDKDVLARKPTIVFIYIGINDVWHWRKAPDGKMVGGTPTDKYEEGLKDIIGKIKAAGARVILCTPSVIGEKAHGTNDSDKMLDEYSDISRKVAADTGVQLNDLAKAFTDYEKEHNPQNRASGVLTGDGVHLNEAGNRFVADQMLHALGIRTEPAGKK